MGVALFARIKKSGTDEHLIFYILVQSIQFTRVLFNHIHVIMINYFSTFRRLISVHVAEN